MPKSKRLIVPEETGDDGAFVQAVERIINAMLQQNTSERLVVIKVDSWFGPRWLNCSGKVLGLLGVRKERLTVPPFVSARIISQRRLLVAEREETDCGPFLHVEVSGPQALNRYLDALEPTSSLVWYSGNSADSGRGSAMFYVKIPDGYITWYVSFAAGERLRVVERHGISASELAGLIDLGSTHGDVPNA